jgi:branched-chain amino acid transport system substrate-binding protein
MPFAYAYKDRPQTLSTTLRSSIFYPDGLETFMKTKYLVGAIAAIAVGTAAAQEVLVVKIGHVAPLSGSQAHYGKDNENGARMAIDELNAKGVMIGAKKARFELLAEDDGADPKQGTAVANKLCDAKVNGVVGHLNSGTTIPGSKIYNQCELPNITPAATNPKITQVGQKYTFRLIANDNTLSAGLAKYSMQTLGLKKIALIDDRSAYGQGIAEIYKKTATELGGMVVSEQFTTDKAVDFMSILTAVKAKKPDLILLGMMDSQAGPLLRQMDQLGMSGSKVMGGDGICTDKLSELSGGAKAVGSVVCAEGGVSLSKTPAGVAWRARYEAKYPNQFAIYSPYVYDAVMVMAEAMVKAGSAEPKAYLPFLVKTDYQGVTAKVIFEPNGDLKDPAFTLYKYEAGKKVAIN